MSDNLVTHTEFLQHKELSGADSTVCDHTHHCYELCYFIDGEGMLDINGAKHSFRQHTFSVTKPYTHHSQTGDYAHVIYVGFYYNDFLGSIRSGTFEDPDGRFLELLLKMENEFSELRENYDTILAECQKLMIFFLLRKQYSGTRGGSTSDTLRYAISFIQENFYTEINTEQLANSLGYSYHRFRHLFKQEFGATINQYITNQRLNHAMQLLRNTSKTVKEIASECGFSNQTRFISAFKSVLNITPTQYRNSTDTNIETYNYHN